MAYGVKDAHDNPVLVYGVYKSKDSLFKAKDGTEFYPARFYDVAGKCIGVMEVSPDGKQTAHANTLFANSTIAAQYAETLRDYHNFWMEGGLSHAQ